MRRALPTVALALVIAATSVASASGYGRVVHNPADRLVGKPIEESRYDQAHHCFKHPSRGALALVKWLQANSRGTFWGIMRCERLSAQSMSLHSEGRAIDWHLSVHSAADRRAARKLILTLLATDRAGNPTALARRMGVQEIIWNCHYWGAGSDRMGPYSVCYDRHGKRRRRVDDTLAHRDHVHLGLDKAGAALRTSFWRAGR